MHLLPPIISVLNKTIFRKKKADLHVLVVRHEQEEGGGRPGGGLELVHWGGEGWTRARAGARARLGPD